MARDRQRAKQRQAERRQARMAARRAGTSPGARDDVADAAAPVDPDDPRRAELDADAGPVAGATGAPPENTGRSDTVAESPPPAPILDDELEGDELDDEGDFEGEVFDDELEPDGGAARPRARGPRGIRGDGSAAAAKPSRGGGSKVLGFLIACWAELQRVQWPDRRTLTQLTGIVLFFVVLAGAYLGALDAIFQRLVQAIL
ncbi:MAG TPA: preprotein translocase subunit SecE [Thermoleophilaceae bacterium]|jgi:preprotein translocase SecE subunit